MKTVGILFCVWIVFPAVSFAAKDLRPESTHINDTRINDTRINDTRINDTRINDTHVESLRLEDVQDWNQFKSLVERQQAEEIKTGQAYMISGSLLVLGGIIGYHNAHTPIEKLAYSLSQSIGVAGIGYGAALHFIGSGQRMFYESVNSSRSLSDINRNELVQNYVSIWRNQRQNEKLIKIITHAVVAAVNIHNGLREEGELRQGLVALGGINFLAALSISFQ